MQTPNRWRRGLPGRISRRRALRGSAAGALGLAGMALVGCGGDEEDEATPAPASTATQAPSGGSGTTATATPTEAASEPKRGGTYRGSFTGPFAGVDPHNSVYGGAGIIPQVYSYLLRTEVLRPEVGLRRELASAHELMDDQVTWVFTLRPDARIAPNPHGIEERALDSEDVVANWDRISNAKSGANGYSFFARWVESYDAPDAQTVRLVTKRPFAWVEEALGDNLQGAMVPREWLESDKLKGDAVGSGPFMLKELTEGQRAILVPNPNFYDAGTGIPYLDEYQILAFGDIATQRTAFSTRQIDAYSAPDIEEAKELERQLGNVTRFEDKSLDYKSFWMRVDVAPWDDGRVRRAMNLVLNREQYIAIIGKGQGSAIGPVSDVFADYALPPDELARLQPHDPKEAKKLFEAAGVREIAFVHPTSSDMNDFVNILVQQLQQIGISAKPEPQDAGTWVAGYFQSKLEASFSLNQDFKTPDFALQWFRTGGITGNGRYDTQFSVQAVDDAIDLAATTIPVEERVEAYHEAQRTILANDPAFLNVIHEYSNPLVYNDIRNFPHGPGGIDNALSREIWIDA